MKNYLSKIENFNIKDFISKFSKKNPFGTISAPPFIIGNLALISISASRSSILLFSLFIANSALSFASFDGIRPLLLAHGAIMREKTQGQYWIDGVKKLIKDDEINGIKIRFQNVDGLPPKELRKLVDNGKKDLGEGIVVVFANKDDKVGVAVGITDKLTNKFDAVKFVKLSSEIIGGQGGGGRKDFAQAGGQDQSKINEAFEKIKSLI